MRSTNTLANEVVSVFVIDKMGLVIGDQSKLMAVKGLTSSDKMKLVARVVKQNRGPSFVPNYKYCLDSVNATIYVLVLDAEVA